MNRVPPDSTRTYTPFPYTTLFRSQRQRRDLRSDAAKGGEFRHRAGNAAVVRVDDLPRDAPQVARLRFGDGGAMEQIGEGRLVQGGELVRRVRDGEQAGQQHVIAHAPGLADQARKSTRLTSSH